MVDVFFNKQLAVTPFNDGKDIPIRDVNQILMYRLSYSKMNCVYKTTIWRIYRKIRHVLTPILLAHEKSFTIKQR